MASSRVSFLYLNLRILGYEKALKALDLVIRDMNSEKGFSRHDGSHFYYHLVDVTQTLINFGVRDEEVLVASILHDYMEDVEGVTKKMLQDMFGERVAIFVDLLSKKKGVDYKNDDFAMREYLSGIGNYVETALIKTADRMHNFSSMRSETSFEHKKKQIENTEKYFIPFFKTMRKRYARYSNFFFFAKTTIEPLIFEMKQNVSLKSELERYQKGIIE